eukprot:CAMPEP_0169198364 /NCGR_PEP_ID=MMETSP1016-20121227/8772_1 /TAXON_ID=342587 /ORGANISM="Karlodinium micrum, Strain CCMP2283" /LENGTH=90 /DNA_ID=CAMNT_0009275093 /DNA_START=148 /DNA_END=420 /DNA_ORIENTATION=-
MGAVSAPSWAAATARNSSSVLASVAAASSRLAAVASATNQWTQMQALRDFPLPGSRTQADQTTTTGGARDLLRPILTLFGEQQRAPPAPG